MQDVHCTRCGQCCRKGGPLLHREDVYLLDEGHLNFAQLVTLRVGELIHDPIAQKLQPLEHEVIKIAGTNAPQYPWHCVLHNAEGCGLHPLRPAQCRALFCAQPEELQHMYTEGRLTRQDIFTSSPATDGWLALTQAYEEECALSPLISLVETVFLRSELDMEIMDNAYIVEAAEEKILQCIRYDLAFRDLCVQKAGIKPEILSCLLGRPVHIFLRSLGVTVHSDKQGELTLLAAKKGIYFSILQEHKNI